jgi:hypothetical protein
MSSAPVAVPLCSSSVASHNHSRPFYAFISPAASPQHLYCPVPYRCLRTIRIINLAAPPTSRNNRLLHRQLHYAPTREHVFMVLHQTKALRAKRRRQRQKDHGRLRELGGYAPARLSCWSKRSLQYAISIIASPMVAFQNNQHFTAYYYHFPQSLSIFF